MRCSLWLLVLFETLRTVHGAQFPLLSMAANISAPWAPPDLRLPYPVGPNPGLLWFDSSSAASTTSASRRILQPPAPASKQGLLMGDIRAHIKVTAALAQAQITVTAQIYWRRRDHNPNIKVEP
jgi:hypothetical protein